MANDFVVWFDWRNPKSDEGGHLWHGVLPFEPQVGDKVYAFSEMYVITDKSWELPDDVQEFPRLVYQVDLVTA